MSTDKDLEAIEKGEGLTNASTSISDNLENTGVTTEQRVKESGVRKDTFVIREDKKREE
jgi:hypothetical protein